jgi:hypothetical protein
MILFVALFILGGIYRLLSIRYKPKGAKKKDKDNHFTALDMEKEFDDDLITNPAFSSLKINIFHKHRNGNGDDE